VPRIKVFGAASGDSGQNHTKIQFTVKRKTMKDETEYSQMSEKFREEHHKGAARRVEIILNHLEIINNRRVDEATPIYKLIKGFKEVFDAENTDVELSNMITTYNELKAQHEISQKEIDAIGEHIKAAQALFWYLK